MYLSNIDFSHYPGFSWYVIFLLIAGVATILMGTLLGGQTTGWRVLNTVAGLAFLGYGVYLGFIFTGGTYYEFIYVFVVPVLLIWQAIAKWLASRRAKKAAADQLYTGPQYTGQPGQPYTGTQPGQCHAGASQAPGTGWGQPDQPVPYTEPGGQQPNSQPFQPYQQ